MVSPQVQCAEGSVRRHGGRAPDGSGGAGHDAHADAASEGPRRRGQRQQGPPEQERGVGFRELQLSHIRSLRTRQPATRTQPCGGQCLEVLDDSSIAVCTIGSRPLLRPAVSRRAGLYLFRWQHIFLSHIAESQIVQGSCVRSTCNLSCNGLCVRLHMCSPVKSLFL